MVCQLAAGRPEQNPSETVQTLDQRAINDAPSARPSMAVEAPADGMWLWTCSPATAGTTQRSTRLPRTLAGRRDGTTDTRRDVLPLRNLATRASLERRGGDVGDDRDSTTAGASRARRPPPIAAPARPIRGRTRQRAGLTSRRRGHVPLTELLDFDEFKAVIEGAVTPWTDRLTTHRATNWTTKISDARVHAHTLRDGGRILVRALRADDRKEMAARYEELSPTSRRLRFFNAPSTSPDDCSTTSSTSMA